MNRKATALVALAVLLSACSGTLSLNADDPYRPQYHFTAPRNWLNDPNGLVYYDGEYHLFYQHNPFENRWGNLSWGHAVSPDLLRWQDLPVAIAAEPNLLVFSGSVVYDAQDSSRLGRGSPPLVGLYTGYRLSDRVQAQYLAYSSDRGRTWQRLATGPVLDIGSGEFRDPKVFWHAPSRRWIMAIALAVDRKVQFYGSADLKSWEYLSSFGPEGPQTGAWEVPDLIELPYEGGTRWVLYVGVITGGPQGGSGTQYFTGSFDGTRFVPDGPPRWADHGKDFYAAHSWSNLPASQTRPVWLAWMGNWAYTADVPTEAWRGAMTLPRELSLANVDGRPRLVQQPVAAIASLRGGPVAVPAQAVPDGLTDLPAVRGVALEIEAVLEPGSAREFGVVVRAATGQGTFVGYDAVAREVFVDRNNSGRTDFNPEFAGKHRGPLALEGGAVRLRILVDSDSVEVFAGRGETAITSLIFPDLASDGVQLFATGGTARLRSLQAWPLSKAVQR